MENEAEKLQTDLRVAQAFLKAHEEVKAKQAEKKECMYKKAVIAAENRRKKREEDSKYLEALKSWTFLIFIIPDVKLSLDEDENFEDTDTAFLVNVLKAMQKKVDNIRIGE